MKYTRYAVEAIVDQILKDLRVDSETSLDILVSLRNRLKADEALVKQMEKSFYGSGLSEEEEKDFWEDKKAMCSEDVL